MNFKAEYKAEILGKRPDRKRKKKRRRKKKHGWDQRKIVILKNEELSLPFENNGPFLCESCFSTEIIKTSLLNMH